MLLFTMFVGASQSRPVVLNDSQWLLVVLSGYRELFSMVLIAFQLLSVLLNGLPVVLNISQWLARSGSQWFSMVMNGYQWFSMVLYHCHKLSMFQSSSQFLRYQCFLMVLNGYQKLSMGLSGSQ